MVPGAGLERHDLNGRDFNYLPTLLQFHASHRNVKLGNDAIIFVLSRVGRN